MSSGKTMTRQALEFALGVLAAVWLLSTAWQLLQPLLPILAVVGIVVLLGVLIARHRRRW